MKRLTLAEASAPTLRWTALAATTLLLAGCAASAGPPRAAMPSEVNTQAVPDVHAPAASERSKAAATKNSDGTSTKLQGTKDGTTHADEPDTADKSKETTPGAEPQPSTAPENKPQDLKARGGLKVANDADQARKQPVVAKTVPLEATVPVGTAAKMTIKELSLTKAEAEGIGQVAGPAVLITLRVDNRGRKSLDLSHTELLAFAGAELTPLAPLSDPRTTPLEPKLAAGDSATATFLFALPEAKPGAITLRFSTGNGENIQQLSGTPSA
ncbi:hypothetical protein [Glutamicibacter sp. PS]|uniref:hypothetical protein n=1 Tax=Glutamicibacter sp. PS TaxID=3075634 RepID=UPI002848344B|nr:hypothetical protein [Glutamicibacter sp. PS]MDR4533031.1 hypothetical protein [Glutamicibacter sp. PS]